MREAKVLLEHDCFDGAFYLCGYAVECALKARIATQFKRHAWPDRGFVNEIHTHALRELLRLAGLLGALDRERRSNPVLKEHWGIVNEWTELSRYQTGKTREVAQNMYRAVTKRRDGLLAWIRRN